MVRSIIFRVALLIFAVVLAMSLAQEKALATSLDQACGDVCSQQCATHGGCFDYQEWGCQCDWECEDGRAGVDICI